ncbi:MAG: histone deacetylase [Deltaproteobacteria bacterium]|nr:histone deacetylase [Deltaproteobacteria bacterium]
MLVVHSERMVFHDPGAGHPESPERLRAAVRELREVPGLRWQEPREVTSAELERVHHPAYVTRLRELRGRALTLDPDTHASSGTIDAAFLAAGAAIEATEAVCRGATTSALALVRPPGHHAEADAAMGFCFFNNVAVAAAHARAELGCERVLIVDWDVHHGNGTQHIFEERSDVLFVSLHQHPLYPGTGAIHEVGRGAGRGFTVNVPFPGGLGDADYLHALRSIVVPIADVFRPDLVLVSAGFDAHDADPLAGMRLSEQGYARMTRVLKDLARRHAAGRLVMLLEGGYDLDAMPRSLRAAVAALLAGEPVDELHERPSDVGRRIVSAVCDQHSDFWPIG